MEYIDNFITKSGKEIKFRYPNIDDVSRLKDYINLISAEQSYLILQGFQNTIETETKWLKDKLNKIKNNKCVYICGFYNNDLVACSEITLGSDAKEHIGSFGISVALEFRGQGLGQKIMELTIKESIKKMPKLQIIDLEVFDKNIIGKNLYKKLGFIEYGLLPKALKRKGEYDDAVLMYKRVK